MYDVGQILYTVLTEKQIVVPVKVVEQVIVKTLDGEKTDYKLQLPNSKNQKVSIDKFTNLYEDIVSVEDYLTSNAKSAIEKMIKDANTLNVQFFGEEDKIDACNIEPLSDTINHDKNQDSIKIELENGQKANIKIKNIDQFVETQAIEEAQKKT
jgi:hypothetical protein